MYEIKEAYIRYYLLTHKGKYRWFENVTFWLLRFIEIKRRGVSLLSFGDKDLWNHLAAPCHISASLVTMWISGLRHWEHWLTSLDRLLHGITHMVFCLIHRKWKTSHFSGCVYSTGADRPLSILFLYSHFLDESPLPPLWRASLMSSRPYELSSTGQIWFSGPLILQVLANMFVWSCIWMHFPNAEFPNCFKFSIRIIWVV